MEWDYQRLIDRTDDAIVNRPGRVILAFLLVTSVFALGLGNVSTEAGTQQFAQNIPAQQALEDINREFSPPFQPDTGSTQLIQRDQNVLSKRSLLHMLRAQDRLAERESLRVSSTSSAASMIARELDPTATTLDAQIRAIEGATPTQIDRAVRAAAASPRFRSVVSTDFNRKDASATATIGVVQHTLPGGLSEAAAGQGGSSPLTPIQLRAKRIVATVGGDITVFGSGVLAQEFSQVIIDSLLLVTPAAVGLIVFFLVIAYRDLLDLLLGTFALGMAVIWTFGFLGLAGIPFNQVMIAIPPLLLAVGIDFGIHAINRYREDRQAGHDVAGAMRQATDQLLVAFFIVTGTTVIGFLSNLVSDLGPIKDFGIVAALGIVFTFLIFGVFLPAAKVWLERQKDRIPLPTFSQAPLGGEGTRLGEALQGGVFIARRAPVAFLLLVLLFSVAAGAYTTGVDTSFTQEDFLPPEETPAYLQQLPEPFRPADYSVVAQLNFLERNFETTQSGSVTIYVEGRLTKDSALEQIHRAGRDPPDAIVREESSRHASSTSIVTVIRSYAARDPEFRRLVARNDENGNGIPDDNLGRIYDRLLDSPVRSQALSYLAEDRRSARIVYTVKADASNEEVTADARELAERFRMDATATGSIVVFQAVSDLIFESAVQSLALALGLTVLFLVSMYWLLEGLPSLGLANTVPIVVAVTMVGASMRLLGIAFNAFTATILALTIGLGIDYSVHVVHRFVDERRETDLFTALTRTVRGTGGALAGSMLTTTFGIGVLVLAILEVLGQFGILTALSIAYSFLVSLLVLPSVLVIWDRLAGNDPTAPIDAPGEGGPGANGSDASEASRPGAPEATVSNEAP